MPMLKEKDEVLPQTSLETSPPAPTRSQRSLPLRILATALGAWLLLNLCSLTSNPFSNHTHKHHHDVPSKACVQADPVLPQAFNVSSLVPGNEVRIREWLMGAVRVPTEVFDVMGEIGEDRRWDVFYEFSACFPSGHLTRSRVVTHALVFEWEGSDPSLKPLLLTGHQDVVPVLEATRGMWTHDPYGGEYDEKTGLIWGRGSSDDKSGTIGALAAMELLLESGNFTPARTVILALGMDEETGGKVGAYHIGQWLEEKYGKDSMSILVDEGTGLEEVWGQLYATPAVGEKGYLDVELKVETKGGHSSVPPEHTGIGLISLLIAALERNPHEPYLSPDSPLVTFVSCAADFAPEIPKELKQAIRKVEASLVSQGHKKVKVDQRALKEVEEWWITGSAKDKTLPPGMGKAMVSTTQAIDIINGGVKVNALPEVVTAYVNHRINLASSVGELQQHLIDTLGHVACRYNLDFEAFGKSIEFTGCGSHSKIPKAGNVVLSVAWNSTLEPAPVSPHQIDDPAWRVFAGTIKGVFATRPGANDTIEESQRVIEIAPMISTGNTDTKRYWNLTRNIYRFAYMYGQSESAGNIHTVDEHMPAKTFVEQVRWFMNFIVNVDETREI